MNKFKDDFQQFITLADLPPDPTRDETLQEYADLGLNVCLLTEDNVKLLKEGEISCDYTAAIDRIGQHGMQVWIRNMFNDEDYFDCAEKKEGSNYGDGYEMDPRHITTEFTSHDSVTGFYMADEAYMPNPGRLTCRWKHAKADQFAAFDKMAKLAEWRNKYYPDAFFHVNHVPSQSYDHFFPQGTTIYDYKDFLNSYIDEVVSRVKGNKKSICFDNYPLLGDNAIEDSYLYDILTAANVTKEYNERVGEAESAIFGMCLQTFHVHTMSFDGRHRDIYSEKEITFQMFTAMAAGARLYEYFCYRSYPGGMDGILRLDGSKRIYDLVQRANQKFLGLGPITYGYKWNNGFACAGYEICDNASAFIKAKYLFKKPDDLEVESKYDAFFGCFEKDGKFACAVVNYTDPMRDMTNVTTLKTKYTRATVHYGDKSETVDLQNGVLNVTLGAGCGAFIEFE